ncbi:MarR family transcriptional regulator [Nocardia wallacei]|uniref:MarR family transcriptional regulator n=1 Tax=Nocardia wallacei TaxID=480035 RepID=UPI002457D1A6|nr:helix-turn-helix domain-containing protein [Nocardia wallacei]
MNTDGTTLYAAIPMQIRRDSELSFKAKAIALHLWSESPKFRVSIAALAAETGLSRNTVSGAIDELQQRGWLVRQLIYSRAGNEKPAGEVWHLQNANVPFSAAEVSRLSAPLVASEIERPCSPDEQGSGDVVTETLLSHEAGFSQPCSPVEQGSPQPCSPSEQQRSESTRSEGSYEVKGAREAAGRQLPIMAPLSTAHTQSADELSRFGEFWNAYPRKKNLGDAREAWAVALTKTSAQTIIDAAHAYANDPERDPKTTYYPHNWLAKEKWADEYTPSSNPMPKKDNKTARWSQGLSDPAAAAALLGLQSLAPTSAAITGGRSAIEERRPIPSPVIDLNHDDWKEVA